MKRLSRAHLFDLRNKIPIDRLLTETLRYPTKYREGFLRFECPLCREMNSAVNPKTNLARCFACQRNFNPLDLVIVSRGCSFSDAVRFLEPLLPR